MSTLKVNTIQNASGGSSSTADQLSSGRIRAWVNLDGGGSTDHSPTIQASFNVTSIADAGTSKYNVYWDTDFSNTSYAIAAFAGYDNYAQQNWVSSPTSTGLSTWKQTSMVQLIAVYANNTSPNRDPDDFSVMAIGT
tara:strand:- start:243 stop:653 length:411 start_codon:yes stop_codon:yes gene_type:complete